MRDQVRIQPNLATTHTPRVNRVTRLAPSPTGSLHLGNARTFLINWAIARQRGWSIVLRIEDLDTPRIKPGVNELTIDLLRWLGIDWDSGPTLQSTDLAPYRDAMQTLASKGLCYPITASRTEGASDGASAPQEGSHEARFASVNRPRVLPSSFAWDASANAAWRYVTPEGEVTFIDEFAGPQKWNPSTSVGDFILWTKRNQPAYQLAVVVDDHLQGVTDVVRGDDLLDSAARQLLLYRALDHHAEPTYWHLPLVIGADGKRLAKRHGESRLDMYRAKSVPVERVIGLIAQWCGIDQETSRNKPVCPMSAAEFRERLDLRTITRTPIVFTREDDAWLLNAR